MQARREYWCRPSAGQEHDAPRDPDHEPRLSASTPVFGESTRRPRRLQLAPAALHIRPPGDQPLYRHFSLKSAISCAFLGLDSSARASKAADAVSARAKKHTYACVSLVSPKPPYRYHASRCALHRTNCQWLQELDNCSSTHGRKYGVSADEPFGQCCRLIEH